MTYEFDAKIGNLNVSLYNDGIHDTIANITLETFIPIHGIILNFVLRSPDTVNDQNYQRVFLRTSVNFDKFLKGNRGNFLAGILMEQFVKTLDFELKFPLRKVQLLFASFIICLCNSYYTFSSFKGIKRAINVSFSGALLPTFSGVFMADIEGILKTKGENGKMRTKVTGNLKAYGKVNL